MDRCRAPWTRERPGAERQPSSSISNYLSNHEPIVRRIMCYSTRQGNKQDKSLFRTEDREPALDGPRVQLSPHKRSTMAQTQSHVFLARWAHRGSFSPPPHNVARHAELGSNRECNTTANATQTRPSFQANSATIRVFFFFFSACCLSLIINKPAARLRPWGAPDG